MDRSSERRNLKFTQAMLRELRQKAETDGEMLTLLTYLIDMAYLEASDRLRANWSGDGKDGALPRRSAQG